MSTEYETAIDHESVHKTSCPLVASGCFSRADAIADRLTLVVANLSSSNTLVVNVSCAPVHPHVFSYDKRFA